jgi:hypothetical protein
VGPAPHRQRALECGRIRRRCARVHGRRMAAPAAAPPARRRARVRAPARFHVRSCRLQPRARSSRRAREPRRVARRGSLARWRVALRSRPRRARRSARPVRVRVRRVRLASRTARTADRPRGDPLRGGEVSARLPARGRSPLRRPHAGAVRLPRVHRRRRAPAPAHGGHGHGHGAGCSEKTLRVFQHPASGRARAPSSAAHPRGPA